MNLQIRLKKIIFQFVYFPLYMVVKLWQGTRVFRSMFGLNSCRFYPSCSDYFLNAIRLHGLFCGLSLSVKRLIRCNPLCEGGIDQVSTLNKKGRIRELGTGELKDKLFFQFSARGGPAFGWIWQKALKVRGVLSPALSEKRRFYSRGKN